MTPQNNGRSMFRTALEDITEPDLISLGHDQIPESLTVEFKRDLNLSDRQERAEAAKDTSAMANTVGGRIFYGIDEQTLPDGSVVAGSLCPLTDGTVVSRLEDVLLASIHPRPRFRTRKIPVGSNTGFVLIVEVYPAYASDLHMVTGFKENRFYKRGEQRTILMTEPEVRESYVRIAASRQALDSAIEAAVASELALVPATQESVMIIPWFGHSHLVNPQQLGPSLGQELANGPLKGVEWCSIASHLAVVSDGYQAWGPDNGGLHECQIYACVRRTGLVHLAEASARAKDPGPANVRLDNTLEMLVAALLMGRHVLDRCAYWGPIRVVHRLNINLPFYLKDPKKGEEWESIIDKKPVAPGTYTHVVPEVNLRQEGGSIRLILRELLHQIFQTNGEAACPWFLPSGEVDQQLERFLRKNLHDALKV